jgi:hypothetical protein
LWVEEVEASGSADFPTDIHPALLPGSTARAAISKMRLF